MKLHIAVALLALAAAPAWAVNKCVIDGRTVYQDSVCPGTGPTGAEDLERRERIEALHRRLDQLQARGVGLVQRAPATSPPPVQPSDRPEPSPLLARRRPTPEQREAEGARLTAKTMAANEKSRQALVQIVDGMVQSCGGKSPQQPVVGMSDETFRNCTLQARFGGVQQIVAIEHEGVPLRLYVFPRGKVERVYSVGGVVTAVKP